MPGRPLTLLLAAAAVVALPGCGGSGDDSGSTGRSGYEQSARTSVRELRALGDSMASTISAADQVADPVLAKRFRTLQARAGRALAGLRSLDAPDPAAQRRVDALVTAFGRIDADIDRLAAAAAASDVTAAQAATQSLAVDSPPVKDANDALGMSVGVPKRPVNATATADGRAGVMLTAGLVGYLRDATNRVEKLMRSQDDPGDAAFAAQLLDLEKLIRASLGMIDRIAPATDEESMALAKLDDTLQTLDGDLGSLSSSVGAHDEKRAARTARKLAFHLEETRTALGELDAVASPGS